MNILLQHWHGEPTEVERQSWECMARYAESMQAEHRVLHGEYVTAKNPQMNKLHMLSPEFDAYDVVVMVDSDMFPRQGAANIFEASGVGVCGKLQASLKESCRRRVPHRFGRKDGDFYGGAVYRLTREDRNGLRRHLSQEVMRDFDAYHLGVDEGVMHYLATCEGFIGRGLPEAWSCSSYEPQVVRAHFVHIRRRVKAGSERRRGKVDTLHALRRSGVL